MRRCLATCKKRDIDCPIEECKYWIDSPKEYNCMFEAIDVNDSMTLREIAERLNISYVRVKQIQDGALKKIGHLLKDEAI